MTIQLTSGFEPFSTAPDPGTSDPKELILGCLDWYRETLLRKLWGLSDSQLRSPVRSLGWPPLGMVQHLGWVDRRWLRWGFAAEDVVAYPPGGTEDEWRIGPNITADMVLSGYRAEVQRCRAVTASAELGERARVGGRFKSSGEAPSLGRILCHLLQEYARHVGQLDVARELIDGVTGE